jgi:hypothetical protein
MRRQSDIHGDTTTTGDKQRQRATTGDKQRQGDIHGDIWRHMATSSDIV